MAKQEVPIWFITDPPQGTIDISSHQVRSRFHQRFDENIESFDICGRSWTLPPQDLIELAFNTFKPLYCHGIKDISPLSLLLQRVQWYWYMGGGILRRLSLHEEASEHIDPPLKNGLLIISSDQAIQDLLGTTINRIYSWHSRRDDRAEEKLPLLLSHWKPPSDSLLTKIHGQGKDIELIVLPEPREGIMFMRAGDKKERYEELRLDYLRRVHSLTGCDQHGVW